MVKAKLLYSSIIFMDSLFHSLIDLINIDLVSIIY